MSSSLFPWNNSPQVKPESIPVPALYTRSPDTSGWLKVQLKENSKMVFLPEYTQVEFIKTENGRSYFIIKDGIYRNKIASLKKENYDKYIFLGVRGNGATIHIKILGRKKEISPIRNKEYNQLWATLSFGDVKIRITLDSNVNYTETDKNNPTMVNLNNPRSYL